MEPTNPPAKSLNQPEKSKRTDPQMRLLLQETKSDVRIAHLLILTDAFGKLLLGGDLWTMANHRTTGRIEFIVETTDTGINHASWHSGKEGQVVRIELSKPAAQQMLKDVVPEHGYVVTFELKQITVVLEIVNNDRESKMKSAYTKAVTSQDRTLLHVSTL